MHIVLRFLGVITVLCCFGLIGCAGGPSPSAVVDGLRMVAGGLDNGLTLALKAEPALMAPDKAAKMLADLKIAEDALATLAKKLSSSAPPSATDLAGTLAGIDAILNSVVDVAAGIPAIPPPADRIIQAAAVLLPAAEALLNPLILDVAGPRKASASLAAGRLRGAMPLEDARSILRGGAL